jgi:hypothetical protein
MTAVLERPSKMLADREITTLELKGKPAFEMWADDKSQQEVRESQGSVSGVKREILTEFDIQLQTQVFWIQKGKIAIRSHRPLTVTYRETTGAADQINPNEIEIKDWDLTIPMEQGIDWTTFPDVIGRCFFNWYSHALQDTLNKEERQIFARICAQVDYYTFSALVAPARYLEAMLVTKDRSCTIVFGGRSVKLNPRLTDSLHVLREGDTFGAYFKIGRDNEIISIESLVLIDIAKIDEDVLAGQYVPRLG